MRSEWDLDDLIASWTLIDADQEQLVKLHEGSRLSFALMVKFFEIEGRFPRHGGELPPVAVDFVARQLGVPADAQFEVTGRAVERLQRFPLAARRTLLDLLAGGVGGLVTILRPGAKKSITVLMPGFPKLRRAAGWGILGVCLADVVCSYGQPVTTAGRR